MAFFCAAGEVPLHEIEDRLPDHLFRQVAQHLRHPRVDEPDDGLFVQHPDALVGQLDDLPVLPLALPQREVGPLPLRDLGAQRVVGFQQCPGPIRDLCFQPVLGLGELFLVLDVPGDVAYRDEVGRLAPPLHLDHAHLDGHELPELAEDVHLHRLGDSMIGNPNSFPINSGSGMLKSDSAAGLAKRT